MKKTILILTMMTVTIVAANNTAQNYAIGCGIALQFKNLMGDKEKVLNECKNCITDVPMYKVDKTTELVDSLVPVCTNKYFEERNKSKK